jgi:hypothetical protein
MDLLLYPQVTTASCYNKEVSMKTTLSLVVTLFLGAMLLVSFQNDNNVLTADLPSNIEVADQYLVSNLNPLVPGEEDNFYNEPDPFCGKTTIHYQIEYLTRVKLMIRCPDQGLITLVNADLKPGFYSVEFDACKLPCGSYTAYLITDYGKYMEPMKKIMDVHKPPIHSKD